MPDVLMLAPFVAVFVAVLAFAVYSEEKAQRQRESDRASSTRSFKRAAAGTAPKPRHAGTAGPATRRESPTQPEDSGARHRSQGDLSKTQQGSPEDTSVIQCNPDPSPQHKKLDVVDLAARWNARVFAAAPKTHFMFQPIRRMLPEGIPTWYCPELVIDGRDARSVFMASTDVELVVLQPVDSDENDPNDRLRTFLLPLSEEAFQVLHVPVSAWEIASRVLSWNEVRLLLERGYRSVGRDDLVDYGRPIPIQPWSHRCRFPEHDRVFYSVAVSPYDGQLISQYATGHILLHVRKLRPRGAVQVSYTYRDRVSPLNVCLTFVQRYSGYVCAERQIYGRLLPFDEEREQPPQHKVIVDVTAAGTIVNIFATYLT